MSIVRIALLSTVLLVCSLVLPRLLGAGGFASATSAALLFLILFALSFALALWSLVRTVNAMPALNPRERVLGLLPAVLVNAAGLWVYLQL